MQCSFELAKHKSHTKKVYLMNIHTLVAIIQKYRNSFNFYSLLRGRKFVVFFFHFTKVVEKRIFRVCELLSGSRSAQIPASSAADVPVTVNNACSCVQLVAATFIIIVQLSAADTFATVRAILL